MAPICHKKKDVTTAVVKGGKLIKKHRTFSLNEKLDVIGKVEAGEIMSTVAKFYSVNESTVHTTMKSEDAIGNGKAVVDTPVRACLNIVRLVHDPFFATNGSLCGVKTLSTSCSFKQTAQTEEPDLGEPQAQQEGEHESEAEDAEDQLKHDILDAALPFVHSFGWSHEAISQGADTLGYSAMIHGMFPGGGVELVNHFYCSCNSQLDTSLEAQVREMEANPELKKGTTAFIASAVEERLRMNTEYIDSWHTAWALHASPRNAPSALHNIGTLLDTIWYHAGDRSYDFNWYTKRGILAAVYKSSELYMLQDKSQDFQDTWAFMNRRLSDVHGMVQCAKNANTLATDFMNISKAGILTALNIIGMNSKSRF